MMVSSPQPLDKTFYSQVVSGLGFEYITNSVDAMLLCEGSSDYLFVAETKNQNRAAPTFAFIEDLPTEKFRLAQPMAVLIEEADGQFIARDPHHDWLGYGDSEEKALDQFLYGMVGDLNALSSREDSLSDALKEELSLLRQLIVIR